MQALLGRFRSSQNNWLLGVSVIVGLTTGLLIWLFRAAIEFFHEIFVDVTEFFDPTFGALSVILSLALGGLIVGAIMDYFVGEERHHGVAGIMEAVTLAGGAIALFPNAV